MVNIVLLKMLNHAQKEKPYPKKFDGENYYYFGANGRKSLAEQEAEEIRMHGFKARLLFKESGFYEIYVRRK